jgi:hypothetical protein
MVTVRRGEEQSSSAAALTHLRGAPAPQPRLSNIVP